MTTAKAENPITQELVKSNVTETVLANLKKDYLPLKINGINDAEGYKIVHDARIKCRDLRTLTENICKKGRENAVRIQKDWISKEKEVVAQISEVEQHLKKQEDAIDAEKEAIKIKAERLLKLPGRKEQVKGIEAFLGELTDEMIMKHDDNQWNQVIVIAQGSKLAKQQKEIDDAKALEIEKRTALRVNELFAGGAKLEAFGAGGRCYKKGNVRIFNDEVEILEDDKWKIKLTTIINAIEPTTPIQTANTVRIEPTVSQPKIAEQSDEEKLFLFASTIEKLSRPELTTTTGKATLIRVELLITQAINLLRQ